MSIEGFIINGNVVKYDYDELADKPSIPTQTVIDDTLSIAGDAADAKATGDAFKNVELSDEIKTLVQKKGYYDYVHLDWESGSINYPAGTDKNPDVNVIRTPLPRIQLTGNMKFFVTNTKYRIKFYTFPDATSSGTAQSSWYNTVGTKDITIDPTKYYRIQIATNTATSMNVEEALKSILIVYDSNAMASVTEDNFANELAKNGIVPTWEVGGLNYINGNNADSTKSIRTQAKNTYEHDYHITVLNSNYKVRWLRYSSLGVYDGFSSWFTNDTIFRANNNILYRFEITTADSTDIDKSDALANVLFDPMPSLGFWYDEIESKAQTVNSYMTDGVDKTAFLFVTDTHWNDDVTYLNHYGVNTPLMKYLADRCNIQYLIHGGDLNSENRSNKNIARENMTRPMSMMRNAFDHVLVTRGNHDDNIEGNNNVWSYVITQSDSYSYMFRNTKDVVFGKTGTYFYHDIPFEKVRIISLDCVDFPYDNSVDATKSDLKILAYGYDQLQWFCDTLSATPSDYHVVIYTHAMLAPSAVTIDHPNDSPQTRAKNYLTVCDILKAYKNRATFSETMNGSFVTVHQNYYTGTVTADFTSADATIVAVFSGHEHIDCIEEILDSNGNGIGIYNTCTQNSSNLFSSSVLSYSYQHPMAIGTTTELVWDVVVIDRANCHVDMIRIGAYEANTDVSAVTVRSFNYS